MKILISNDVCVDEEIIWNELLKNFRYLYSDKQIIEILESIRYGACLVKQLSSDEYEIVVKKEWLFDKNIPDVRLVVKTKPKDLYMPERPI